MSTLWELLVRPIRDLIIKPKERYFPPPERNEKTSEAAPARRAGRQASRDVSRVATKHAGARAAAIEGSKKQRPGKAEKPTAQQRYDRIVRDMLAKYDIKVRRWRRTSSGVAWVNQYRDGSTKRFLESPRPKTPLSMSIFLHEVGHHAIGLGVYKPRCLEEYHAWMFSLNAMRELGVPITERVEKRVRLSLRYAVGKARRRGIQNLPIELLPYLEERPGGDSNARPAA